MKPIFILNPRVNWICVSEHADLMYLDPYVDQIHSWYFLSKNKNALPLLKEHPDKISWGSFMYHPHLCELFLEKHLDKINWDELCRNPNVIPFLEKHLDRAYWHVLSGNPGAIALLEKYPHKINWVWLSANPNAIHLLEQNKEKIHWETLCKNPNPKAIDLLKEHILLREHTGFMNEIDWCLLSANPNALSILEKYPDQIQWLFASSNPCIFPLLEQNLDKIKWDSLCYNLYPEYLPFVEKHKEYLCNRCWYLLSSLPVALPLLEKYPEKIRWCQLSRNPAALHLLSQHPEKIIFHDLCANPNAMHLVFPLDYRRMYKTYQAFREELEAFVFDPDRTMRVSAQYGLDLRNYLRKIYG